MAMLAEPRRKQKISIDPRGATWSQDDEKIGQKLMEKMGWSKGKGLGSKEDGMTDHVQVKVKNDQRGVGCNKRHADNWIAHQDDFNALLANLQQDHGSGDGVADVTKVISLEQKSKSSKARVHYQKFTKGKDLSLKSESDLNSVFGKRASQSGKNTPQTQSEPNSDTEDRDQSHGIVTVTSTDSVQDYFKRKMEEKRNKLLNGSPKIDIDQMVDTTSETKQSETSFSNSEICKENEHSRVKKKKKAKKRKLKNGDMLDDNTEVHFDCGNIDSFKEKVEEKRNKHQKIDSMSEITESVICFSNSEICIENDHSQVKKRKKDKKRKCNKVDILEDNTDVQIETDNMDTDSQKRNNGISLPDETSEMNSLKGLRKSKKKRNRIEVNGPENVNIDTDIKKPAVDVVAEDMNEHLVANKKSRKKKNLKLQE